MRRWIQARNTPTNLSIVECTDCSITIEWFIDGHDECLSYELDHRQQGTNNWSTGIVLSEDVIKTDDERPMYKLQDLQPDTYYELKIRSVYYCAKSLHSETMTQQTLTKPAPKKFKIIGCTDCSITIEWFMDVLDECISYEIDDRPPGTENLPVRTFVF
ncbi:TN [Mytilus edulis]|uniref:TN n=1 Tax=Mytilus edulis TaxID=6550 RepID=A0A8S3QPW9_MYTED|nr:TN [Mytilus edulis]